MQNGGGALSMSVFSGCINLVTDNIKFQSASSGINILTMQNIINSDFNNINVSDNAYTGWACNKVDGNNFENIVIYGCRRGFQFFNCNGNNIRNMRINGCSTYALNLRNGARYNNFLQVYSSRNNTPGIQCDSGNNSFDMCVSELNASGVVFSEGNCVLKNSRIRSNVQHGVRLLDTGNIIEGCIIAGNDSQNDQAYDGIYAPYGNQIIKNNLVYDNDRNDIGIYSDGCTVEGNVTKDNGGASLSRNELVVGKNGYQIDSCSTVQSTQTYTATGMGTLFNAGDVVSIRGFANSASNGNKTILTTPTADTFTVSGSIGADESGVNNVDYEEMDVINLTDVSIEGYHHIWTTGTTEYFSDINFNGSVTGIPVTGMAQTTVTSGPVTVVDKVMYDNIGASADIAMELPAESRGFEAWFYVADATYNFIVTADGTDVLNSYAGSSSAGGTFTSAAQYSLLKVKGMGDGTYQVTPEGVWSPA